MKRLLLLLTLIPSLICAQQSISGTFSPAEQFTYAFLYRATPTGSDYIDRAQLADDGNFSIAFDAEAKPGIYKIVYALPPEENNFDFIYNGKESVAFTFDLDKGLEFTNSNENKLWASYMKSMDMINQTLSNFYTQESTDKKAYLDIIKTLSDTQTAYEDSSKETLASQFIKANSPYIPQEFEDLSTYSKNLKRTYLDHIDFGSPLLQSSDFLIDRVLAYIFGMTANTSNAIYKKDVDHLMATMGDGHLEIKTILYEMIWRRFKDMDNPELANYVADNHLLELTKIVNYEALTEQLIVYKNNTVGNKAANFDLAITKDGETITTTLHDLNISKQYLVVFWSSTCGHCLDELPKLKTMLANKKDLKVIAFGLEDDAENWQKKIAEFPDFIHVLGLGKWNNPTSDAYGIESTPSYFLLDTNKTIVAKPYDVEALKVILK
ncbi:TlpA family protein disulfide reductase [Psychroserpens luteolus]|uniref:TlpA family protein disulfide reductase n=1 Tax=Psychroserpens luteolus TaxID=2855840 RepID=UPI001E2EBE9D|nr:TlpA disulfide reductase family protein [Psychroserpens luteolus]MCD2258506.1 TlpA family protein disulfide reductase [Psychroserpens luteolus]